MEYKIIMEMDSGEIFRNQGYERDRSRSNDRKFIGNDRRNNRSVSNSRSRSDSRVSTNGDRIRCFEC